MKLDKDQKRRAACYALTPMVTIGKAKLELMKGALALSGDDCDPAQCMRHAFAAREILETLTDDLEKLARECEALAYGADSKGFLRIQHADYLTFYGNWHRRFKDAQKQADSLKRAQALAAKLAQS